MTRALGAALVVAGIGVVAAVAISLSTGEREPIRATLSLAQALGTGDMAGYARVFEPRAFAFPRDHGPHPEYRTEWWYFTGNLEAEDGRMLGFQLTFFRSALAPRANTAAPDARTSAWATDQAYMAHFAVTDGGARRFEAFDRFARSALGLAGARAAPFRVWLEDWSAESMSADATASFPLRLQVAEGDVAIDLVLEQGKRPVFHGERGLSRKGEQPGNASYYYSLTRMPTRGTVMIGGRVHDVTGTSWMDREWGTSALDSGVAGWDWFALQLADSTELMLYRLRTAEGEATRFSGGTFIAADGTATTFGSEDAQVTVVESWSSPRDGAPYPSHWRVRVPALTIDVEIEPLVADQELNLAVRYWEGTARVQGTRAGRAARGRAYVELTGYTRVDDITPADRRGSGRAR